MSELPDLSVTQGAFASEREFLQLEVRLGELVTHGDLVKLQGPDPLTHLLRMRGCSTMVYLWRIPDRTPDAIIARYRRPHSPDRFTLAKGVLLKPDQQPEVHFEFKGTTKELAALDCLPNDAQLPVAGLRALEVLESLAPEDFQVIRTVTHMPGGIQNTEFSVLNVSHSVMAIDHDASIVKLIPGTSSILRFRKLVYQPDCLGSHALARDAEYLSHILASERLVAGLRAIGATGVDLKRAETIEW